MRVEDLLALKTEAKVREAGKLRLEGKEYVVAGRRRRQLPVQRLRSRILAMRQLSSAIASALCVAALLDAGTAQAQLGHGFTPQDIESGGLLYQANCTGCHGPEGDGVAGVNLGSGKFRRATSDEEVARIIGGVPGTAMPPSAFSEAQACHIVAYLRSLAAPPRGPRSPAMPRQGQGDRRGQGPMPVVSQRRRRRQPRRTGAHRDRPVRRTVELQRSLVEPSAEIRTDNRSCAPCTRRAEITGRLINQDTFTVSSST